MLSITIQAKCGHLKFEWWGCHEMWLLLQDATTTKNQRGEADRVLKLKANWKKVFLMMENNLYKVLSEETVTIVVHYEEKLSEGGPAWDITELSTSLTLFLIKSSD